jgi:hypothetical protein
MLHLYALTEHPAKLPEDAGPDEPRLRAVTIEGTLDAVVAEIAERPGAPTEAAILAHARVVEAIAALNDAVLPARFGGAVAGEQELAGELEDRLPQLTAALERVRGCVEVGLRVLDQSAEDGKQSHRSGREYMLERLAEVRAAERLASEIHEFLAASARDSSYHVLASPQLLLSAAYLVPRAEVESFRAAVEEAERDRPGLAFVCTGPWPPYSFALVEREGQ